VKLRFLYSILFSCLILALPVSSYSQYEVLTIQPGTLRAVTSEVAILSLRDGKIVVTSIEARTRLY
jgi:hypothetical protein